tara:strand:+ start:228 stop:686 length:459 start_codon:yes stop_codon:yes gene_type:complete
VSINRARRMGVIHPYNNRIFYNLLSFLKGVNIMSMYKSTEFAGTYSKANKAMKTARTKVMGSLPSYNIYDSKWPRNPKRPKPPNQTENPVTLVRLLEVGGKELHFNPKELEAVISSNVAPAKVYLRNVKEPFLVTQSVEEIELLARNANGNN